MVVFFESLDVTSWLELHVKHYLCVCPYRQPNPGFLHSSVHFPPSVMLLAAFCNQVHSYFNQHPAAHFPNQIIQNTQMCHCAFWGYGENSPGKLWESSFPKKYFHMHTFSVTEQHCRCSKSPATQDTAALQKLLFKLSTRHPEQLSALDATHALPPFNLRWWPTFTQKWKHTSRRR